MSLALPGRAPGADKFLAAAGVLLASATVVGALAAHALQRVLSPAQIVSLHTAVNYQFFNALGLLLVGVLLRSGPQRGLQVVAWLLIGGIVCFSGGIYVMLAGAPSLLGLVTPLGGVLLICAWLLFSVTVLRGRP
ncbi:MAG: DUF423 domain-containing protein [Pseudomonadota bacterium]